MNPGGVVVVILGVWIGCQVWGGHALERLGIVSPSAGSSTTPTAAPAVAPAPKPGSAGQVWNA